MDGQGRERWAFLAAASMARLSTGFQFQALPSLAPALTVGLGLGLAEIGALTGLYMLPGVVMSLLAGLVLMRFGVRRTMLAAYALLVLSGALAALADGFETLAAARLIGGAGAVGLAVAGLKGLMDRFEARELAFANGVAGAAQPFGMGFAMLIFAMLGAAADWRMGFLMTAGVGLAGFAVTLLAVRRLHAGPGDLARAARPTRAEWARLILLGLTVAPFVGFFYAYLSLLPSFLHETGWSPDSAGLALGALGWAPILGAPLGGWIAGRTGRPILLIVVCVPIWGAAAAASAAWGLTPMLLAAMLIFGPLPVGVVMSQPARGVAPERRALASGVFTAFLFAGAAAFPALAAVYGELAGGEGLPALRAGLSLCGYAMPLMLIPLLLFDRSARRAV